MHIILGECNDEVHLQTTDKIMLNQKQPSATHWMEGVGWRGWLLRKGTLLTMLPAGSLSNWIKSMV